ncbi:IMPACT family protein [Faucicola boevrei]|uniref:IMPACT family protein n=1 Tax=Faucicola boevrei TaxID=346665 RepID=UPI000361D24C|nr:YigZ family protein [Moraxella boevrei]
MSYSTLAQPCQASLTIKKSEFLAFAYPINNKEQIMFHVEHLRQTYPDARHICTAYIIGNPNNTTSAGFDDDGEPNGTAGKPILNVLQHKAIGNCLVAVVRYFGGIKLGAGGLTRAYSNATQAVVDKMILTAFIPTTILTVQMDFANEAFVRHILTSFDAVILSVDYDKLVNLSIEIAENQCQQFEQKLGIYAKIVKTVYK